MMQRRPGRSGNVQILFAMLAFGLMGMAGLVIDLGIARFSQAHMQSTVDVTAYEGLRFAHENPMDWRPETVELSKANVDEDMNADQDAGPGFTLTGGIGEMNASALVQPPAPPAFLNLQPNDANAAHGDIVQGKFEDKFDTHPRKREGSDYLREDFSIDSDATKNNAVLVRARRTNSAVMPADDEEAGVSSSLPTLPLLFGMGSLVRPEVTGYSVRKHGLSVRATAIAQLRPVASVGFWNEGADNEDTTSVGVAPFVVSIAEWEKWKEKEPADDSMNPIVLDRYDFTKLKADQAGPVVAMVLTQFGDPYFLAIQAGASMVNPTHWYLPIYAEVSGTKIIVGFGRCDWDRTKSELSAIKLNGGTATRNASSAWVPGSANVTDVGRFEAFRKGRQSLNLPENPEETTQAPALVR